MMIERVYRTVQILSIDIVIGTTVLLRFFCVQMEVNIGWQVYALLGGTVWIIYTLDHLNDAKKLKCPDRQRYSFHKKYRNPLLLAIIIVLLVLFTLVFFIPEIIRIGGTILGIFALVYVIVQYKISDFIFKEFYVAVIYTFGILMAPFVMSQSIYWELILLLFLLTFLNLIILSRYEKEEDLKDKFKSIATRMQGDILEKFIFILISIGLAFSLLNFDSIFLYFTIGFLVYGLMSVYPNWFRKFFRYRIVGDGIFLMPILLI